MARDYYGLLNVGSDASDQELKRAYRKLARELHPDVNPDEASQKRFQEITAAYEVLSDPEKRRVVDMGGDPLETGGGGHPGAGFGGGFGGGLGDVFDAFFGGGATTRGPRSRVQPGSDALIRVRLTLEECATGVTKKIEIDTAVLCDSCAGKGSASDTPPTTCGMCHGAGEVQTVQRSMLGNVMTNRPCGTCDATGFIISDPCNSCGGDGRVRQRRTISPKIPAGVATGTRVRLRGQGEVGPGGGAAGDLYVEVVEQEHASFMRDSRDLHCTITIPMVDAALGTSVSFDDILGNDVTVKIPAGTQSGTTMTVKNSGMPVVSRENMRGDLIVHCDVVVPTSLDSKQKKLLTQLRDTHTHSARLVTEDSSLSGGLFSRLRDAFAGR